MISYAPSWVTELSWARERPKKNPGANPPARGVTRGSYGEGERGRPRHLRLSCEDNSTFYRRGSWATTALQFSNWRCAYGQAFRGEVRLRAGIHAIPVRPD